MLNQCEKKVKVEDKTGVENMNSAATNSALASACVPGMNFGNATNFTQHFDRSNYKRLIVLRHLQTSVLVNKRPE